jgi:uncharacterized protein involved in response to NO
MEAAAGTRRTRAPFRPFFLLAAVDAILGAAVWLPFIVEAQGIGRSGIPAGEWHRAVLLFGTVPAILAGFLLTALPRWTGRPVASRRSVGFLLALWLCGRAAFVIISPAAGVGLMALFLLLLLALAADAVIASRDRRNLKILLLLLIFCCSTALTAASWRPELALRMGLASIVGLIMIIGGRLVPTLTLSYASEMARQAGVRRSALVEQAAAILAASALCAWVAAPQALMTGVACAGTSVAHLMRAGQWRSWQSRSSAVVALHTGYGWIVVGFALLAIHILVPTSLGRAAAIHAWTIGAVGTMGIAVMASMIRKHSGNAFERSSPATAAFISMTASCMLRLPAELLPGRLAIWTALSASLWISAFGLFLVAFLRVLLRPAYQPQKSKSQP